MAEPQQQQEVSAEVGPSGVKGTIKGYHLGNVLQLVMAGVLTFIGLLMWDLRVEAKATNERFIKSMEIEHEKIRVAIEKNVEAQEEMNFILTLSVDDRERLGLNMPESLRRKLGSRTIGANPYGRAR